MVTSFWPVPCAGDRFTSFGARKRKKRTRMATEVIAKDCEEMAVKMRRQVKGAGDV
jgi:hypothetical protein